jgi:hypothetical protein
MASPSRRSFRALDPDKIVATAQSLQDRVGDRFPESGLCRLAGDLVMLAEEAKVRAGWLGRRNRWLFSASIVLGALAAACSDGCAMATRRFRSHRRRTAAIPQIPPRRRRPAVPPPTLHHSVTRRRLATQRPSVPSR